MFEEGCQCLPEGGGDGKFGMVVEKVGNDKRNGVVIVIWVS